MNVKEIVAEYLMAEGYDGLFNDDADCCCAVDDLFPCNCYEASCKPGYRIPCNAGCGEYNFCISAEKQRGCQLDEREWDHE